MSAPPKEDLVTVTIDGFEISVPKGTLLIRAAEQLGVQIPGSAITRCSSRPVRAGSAWSRSPTWATVAACPSRPPRAPPR